MSSSTVSPPRYTVPSPLCTVPSQVLLYPSYLALLYPRALKDLLPAGLVTFTANISSLLYPFVLSVLPFHPLSSIMPVSYPVIPLSVHLSSGLSFPLDLLPFILTSLPQFLSFVLGSLLSFSYSFIVVLSLSFLLYFFSSLNIHFSPPFSSFFHLLISLVSVNMYQSHD